LLQKIPENENVLFGFDEERKSQTGIKDGYASCQWNLSLIPASLYALLVKPFA